jgi:O-antigen/teichoic acid export membrane protein
MTAPRRSLAASARSGLIWIGAYKLCHALVQLVLMVVLVRLLTPADYGIYAVVIGIVGFLNAVSIENFIGYTIQVRSEDDVHFQDHFTAALALQGAILVVTNLVAAALRFVPAYSEVAGYIHVLSPIILLSGLGGFRAKMLERRLDWRRLRLLNGLGLIGSVATAILLALAGAGVYALLISPWFKYVPFIVDLFFVARWRPAWTWSRERYRPAWRFGVNRTASSLVAKARALLESNLLALLAGLAMLGYFGRAIGLARLACAQFSTVVLQTVYPVLTKLEAGSPEYRRASRVLMRGIGWTIIPLSALVAILADPLVRLLYGERWLPVVPLLPWAMLLGATAAVAQCGYYLALANQQQRHCLIVDVWGLAGTALALGGFVYSGRLDVYMAGLIATELIGLVILTGWLLRAGGVDGAGILTAIVQPLVAVAVALASAQAGSVLTGWPTGSPAGACLFSGLFGIGYVASLRLLFAESLAELTTHAPAGGVLRQLLLLRDTSRPRVLETFHPEVSA